MSHAVEVSQQIGKRKNQKQKTSIKTQVCKHEGEQRDNSYYIGKLGDF